MIDLEFLKNISLIMASLVAAYGINSWRREFVGRRRIELAEDVLASFYEARDVIATMRNPAGFSSEGSSREPGDNESPEEKKRYDRAYVVIERYKNYQELFNKIHSMRYRFIAQFGADSSKPFNDLNKIVNDIFFAARILPDYWERQGRVPMNESERQKHLDSMHEYEDIFYSWGGPSDPISPRVDALVKDIEEICQKIINPQSWHATLSKKINDPFEINI